MFHVPCRVTKSDEVLARASRLAQQDPGAAVYFTYHLGRSAFFLTQVSYERPSLLTDLQGALSANRCCLISHVVDPYAPKPRCSGTAMNGATADEWQQPNDDPSGARIWICGQLSMQFLNALIGTTAWPRSCVLERLYCTTMNLKICSISCSYITQGA